MRFRAFHLIKKVWISVRNTRDSCDQMQEEKEDIQGERVLLRYDQLPNENYFQNKMQWKGELRRKIHSNTTRSPCCIYCTKLLLLHENVRCWNVFWTERLAYDVLMMVEVLWKTFWIRYWFLNVVDDDVEHSKSF